MVKTSYSEISKYCSGISIQKMQMKLMQYLKEEQNYTAQHSVFQQFSCKFKLISIKIFKIVFIIEYI